MDASLSRNIQRWATYSPSGAKLLLNLEYPSKDSEKKESLEESKQWFASLDLYNISTLIVFGVGTGFNYKAAKEWLHAASDRFLVFLEDDLNTLYQLFETELGSELVFDPRVWIQYLELKNEKDFGLSNLPYSLFVGDIQIAAHKDFPKKIQEDVTTYIHYLKNIKIWHLMEQMKLGKGFFQNFYRNMLDLPESKFSEKMFDQFKDVPAIICGAGPSLDKNRHILETLKDRALIFAGGSAMNVLNQTGFLPHFGVGIDPNQTQYCRLIMNQAFEVPYFFRNRMHSEALRLIHGDHIFVRGTGGYNIGSYFEERLGIEGKILNEGNNVINFSLSIAQALGCNPIIFVGVDLAYTEKSSYAQGVMGYPLYDLNQEVFTKGISEELLQKTDVNGKVTHTLWKWVMESIWFSEYALIHPQLKIINATEGGIGFEGIPNMALEEVSKAYLTKQYDMDALIHGSIQNSPMPEKVSEENILSAIGDFESSLERSSEYCATLRKEFNQVLKAIKEGKEYPPTLVTDEAFEALEKLNQEPAFTYLLNTFSEAYTQYSGSSLEKFFKEDIHVQDQKMIQERNSRLNKRRYEFLKAVCTDNRHQIKNMLEEHALRSIVNEAVSKEKQPAVPHLENLELDFEGEKVLTTYPEGEKKTELYYKKGILDGPSLFYHKNGTILIQSLFVKGIKEGESRLYYDSGELYSRQKFQKGLWDGLQEFYYKDGRLRASLNYKQGLINGEVILYFPNGNKFREILFKNGKREGKEKLWNIGGLQEVEIQYQDNKPFGICKAWYGNGKLAREVIYDNDSKPCSVRQWTSDGSIIPTESLVREDYFDLISKQTEALTKSLESIYQNINQMGNTSLQKDLDDIQKEMDKLKKMDLEMHQELEGENKEAIWKTPLARRLMGSKLEEATKKMAEDISSIEETLKMATDLLKEDKKKNEPTL